MSFHYIHVYGYGGHVTQIIKANFRSYECTTRNFALTGFELPGVLVNIFWKYTVFPHSESSEAN